MSVTVTKLLNSMPFKAEVLENVNCKKDGNGDLICEVGLFGAPQKTSLRLKGIDDAVKVLQCQRDPTGALVCEVETSRGREKIII